MTSDARAALREKVVGALCTSCSHPFDTLIPEAQENMRRHADAAIAVVLEEAARVVDGFVGCDQIAAAIRAMKSDRFSTTPQTSRVDNPEG
jgi:hypothetical protein